MEMEIGQLIPHIEALIFASEKPLTQQEITDLINNAFGFMEDKITIEQINAALEGVIEKYNAEFYPFEVRESGGGWQFLTKREYHKTVAQLNGDKFNKRLSGAAMETLSIIAYKQPITKSEIEAIRGVSSDYAVQKLLEKDLVLIAGRNENLPGKPLIYVTSKSFMDYFGINSAEELPRIKEVLADQAVEPTVVMGEHPESDDDENEARYIEVSPAEAGYLSAFAEEENPETSENDVTATDDQEEMMETSETISFEASEIEADYADPESDPEAEDNTYDEDADDESESSTI